MRIAPFLLSILPWVGHLDETLLNQVKTLTQQGNSDTKAMICQLLDEVASSSCVIRNGTDMNQRPIFVGAQADFERLFVHLLETKEIVQLNCIIHTPAPATPLCTNGEVSENLVDPAILKDPARLLTVKQRPELMRNLLKAGGNLWTVYPKGGRSLRSPEQLVVLDGLLNQHADHLKAIELDCTEMPLDLTGATYFITLADSRTFVLSLQSYQANRPTDDLWGIWFGPRNNAKIADRVDSVLSFLNRRGFVLNEMLVAIPSLQGWVKTSH